MNRKRQRYWADAWNYLAFLVIVTFFAMPLVWLLSLAIRTEREVFVSSLRIIPDAPTIENFFVVLRNPRFVIYLRNGLILAISSSFGAMLVAAPAAYAFSRYRFRGRHSLLIAVLALQMISPLVIMVPLYRYFDRMGWLDSLWSTSLVYIAIAVPLFTWMLKGFIDGIPIALEDAAAIDGCNRFEAFLRVTLPLSLPGLTSAFILTAILGWSQFVIPFILLSRPDKLPISVGIFNFQSTISTTSTHILAAASVLSILPALILFVLLQRFIVSALMAGAVKG